MNVCLISRCRRTCINRMALFGILFALYGTALAYHLGDYGAEAIWGASSRWSFSSGACRH